MIFIYHNPRAANQFPIIIMRPNFISRGFQSIKSLQNYQFPIFHNLITSFLASLAVAELPDKLECDCRSGAVYPSVVHGCCYVLWAPTRRQTCQYSLYISHGANICNDHCLELEQINHQYSLLSVCQEKAGECIHCEQLTPAPPQRTYAGSQPPGCKPGLS